MKKIEKELIKIVGKEKFLDMKKELAHLHKSGVPRCEICHKNFVNVVDSKTKKLSPYSWTYDCKCHKNNKLILSIG